MSSFIDQYFPIILFGGAVAAALAIWFAGGLWRRKKRAAAYPPLANRLGLFLIHDTETISRELAGLFQAFTHSANIDMSNVMAGDLDREASITVFDNSQYVQNMGDVRQTMVVFKVGGLNLPGFELHARGASARLNPGSVQRLSVWAKGAVSGYREINLDGRPDFKKKYALRGLDRAAVLGLFEGGAADFFMTSDGWTVEGNKDRLLIYRQGQLIKPGDIPTFLEQAKSVLARFR